MIKSIMSQIKNIDNFSKKIIYVGIDIALIYCICAVLALWLAPYSPNYSETMALLRCYLEAAPASFVAGLAVGLICDLVIKKDLQKNKEK